MERGGNELPKLLPQVTVVKLLDVPESEILNVFVENKHGIAVAKRGVHRSFRRAEDGKRFGLNKWSVKQHGQTDNEHSGETLPA